MIKGGQVVDLTDLLGDTKSDFNPSILERDDLRRARSYAIPQIVDMQLLFYRKSHARQGRRHAAADHRRADRRGRRSSPRATSRASSSATTAASASWAARCSGRPASTTSRTTTSSASTTRRVATALGKLRELCDQRKVAAPRRAQGLVRRLAAHPRPDGHAVHRPVDLPRHQEGPRRRLRGLAVARARQQRQAVRAGRRLARCVSAKGKDVEAAKEFVKWLWIDQTRTRSTSRRATASTSRPGRPRRQASTKLKTGRPPRPPSSSTDFGHAQNPILWTRHAPRLSATR